MTYIRNNKILVFIIAILLLSNVALLYFFLKKDKEKPKKTPREHMISKLRKEVGFSDAQIATYEAMSDKHKETVQPLFDDLHTAKENFYKLLQQPAPPDSLVNSYLYQVGEKQKAVDKKIFSHFFSLKQVCTPEQLPKYDTVIQRVIKGMINPPKKSSDKDKASK